MTSFEKAVDFVLSFEGGYSNDPRDSGGETNFGISKRSYPNEDIKAMTRERAIEIYRKDYWEVAGCDKLPGPIAFVLFDGAVNQGPPKAIRLLQAALGVQQDGVIGPQTIQSAGNAGAKTVLPAFVGKRAFQYAIHPQFVTYGYGWLRRLAACHQAALEG